MIVILVSDLPSLWKLKRFYLYIFIGSRIVESYVRFSRAQLMKNCEIWIITT